MAKRIYDPVKHADYRNRNADKIKARRKASRDQYNRYNRDYRIRQHGITPQQYEDLSKKQGAHCGICAEPGKLFIDHCHVTRRVRGLLCLNCNVMLGHAKDDPSLLRLGAKYIEKHRAP